MSIEDSLRRLRMISAYVNVELVRPGSSDRNDVIDRWLNACEEHRIHLFGKDEKEESK